MTKRNKRLTFNSPMEILIKSNLEHPFNTEFGHINKRVPQKGGITMMYCESCDCPMQENISNICSLCGGETGKKMLTVKELQGRSIKSNKEGYILIGHEDVKWWED